MPKARAAASLPRLDAVPISVRAMVKARPSTAEPMPLSQDALGRYLRTDYERWAKVIRSARVTID
jgi:hypothetical protein